MSEELKTEEMLTEEETKASDETTPQEDSPEKEDTPQVTETTETTTTNETMADLESHFDDASPWVLVQKYCDEKTTLHVTVSGIVNGGAIAMVEGLRGFIPASKLSLSYVENLDSFLLKEMDVQVIDVDPSKNRLVLSARELLKEKERKERAALIAKVKVGTIVEGTVETLQDYGAFVKLEDGLSGMVHVSQISWKRVKTPATVLKVGDHVKAKVVAIKDGKISLSMKALEEQEEKIEKVDIPKAEEIGTSLGDLFKNIKL